jgi:hypothetical protein
MMRMMRRKREEGEDNQMKLRTKSVSTEMDEENG